MAISCISRNLRCAMSLLLSDCPPSTGVALLVMKPNVFRMPMRFFVLNKAKVKTKMVGFAEREILENRPTNRKGA